MRSHPASRSQELATEHTPESRAPLHAPSLRERSDDIPVLLDYFAERFSTRMEKASVRSTSRLCMRCQEIMPREVRRGNQLFLEFEGKSKSQAWVIRARGTGHRNERLLEWSL